MPAIDMEWLRNTILLLAPLLFSLTVHEFAHARTALAFGDPTAKMNGRVSLNPLVHLDPIGTLVLIVTQMVGWAKPVPVNPLNLEPRRLGDIMVSAAGPLSNLGLAVLFGLVVRLLLAVAPPGDAALLRTAYVLLLTTMEVNVGLFIFNLIPLFPLDGHHILRELLPWRSRDSFMRWQIRYGRILLLAVIIAPPFLSRYAGRQIFSPLHWAWRHVVEALIRVLGI